MKKREIGIQWEQENCGIGRRLLDSSYDYNSSSNMKRYCAV